MTKIEDALELVRVRRYEPALGVLLEAWRDAPSERLERAITRVSARLPAERLMGRTYAKRRKQWLELAEEVVPSDVPRLLAELPRFVATIAAELIGAVYEWDADPRITAGLFRLLREQPEALRVRKAAPFWRDVCEIVSENVRPYQRELLARLAAESTLPEEIAQRLRSIRDDLPNEPELPIDADPALARLLTMLEPTADERQRAERIEMLFAAVYEDPDDDGTRLVLADALSEAADPRGELIALQMARAAQETPTKTMRSRELDLLSAYGREWLGAIEPAIAKSRLVFERGFPSSVVLGWPSDSALAVVARPEWATISAVDALPWSTPNARSADERQRRVRAVLELCRRQAARLTQIDAAPAELLVERSEYRVERLSIVPGHVGAPMASSFPHLVELGLTSGAVPEHFRGLWKPGGLGERLRVFRAVPAADWLDELGDITAEQVVLRTPPANWTVTLSRTDTDGRFDRARFELVGPSSRAARDLDTYVLRGASLDWIGHVSVVEPDDRDGVLAVLERYGAKDVEIL